MWKNWNIKNLTGGKLEDETKYQNLDNLKLC